MNRVASISILCSLAAAGHASAIITGVTGANTTWLTTPPANVNALSGSNAYVWNEKQNVGVGTVPVNISANPTTRTGTGANLSSATGPFASHMIHFAPVTGGLLTNSGSATFHAKIIGVIFSGGWLSASDGIFGSPTTIYPTWIWGRSYTTSQLFSSSLTINGNTISWFLKPLNAQQYSSEIRVLTAPLPAPGALALIPLGGLFAARRGRVA